VLTVKGRNGQVCDFVLDELSKEQIQGRLKPIVDGDAVLCNDGASWYKTFAKQENIAHRRLITLDKQRVVGKEFHIQNVNSFISRLKHGSYGLMGLEQIIWPITLVGGGCLKHQRFQHAIG
jgi:hypothetical protein